MNRVQRSRARGSKQPANTLYCGRGSLLGNPYRVFATDKKNDIYYVENFQTGYISYQMSKRQANAHAKEMYAIWFESVKPDLKSIFSGYEHLSCFCPLDLPCHVDFLIEKWNEAQ